MHTILKKILKVRRLTARWIPHLLTDEQKRQRVKTARELLKRYPKFDKNVFRHLKQGIQEFHRKYVLVPTDKATNNIVVVCRLH